MPRARGTVSNCLNLQHLPHVGSGRVSLVQLYKIPGGERAEMNKAYSTSMGTAYCADSIDVLSALPDDTVDLVVTSPPYALHFKKEYGNAD